MYFKIAPQRDNRAKVSALLRAGHKVSEFANLVGVSRTTVYAIRSALTLAKVSTDVQAMFERLLRIVTAVGMLFEAVPGRPCANVKRLGVGAATV